VTKSPVGTKEHKAPEGINKEQNDIIIKWRI
jgi:hypothetical protein